MENIKFVVGNRYVLTWHCDHGLCEDYREYVTCVENTPDDLRLPDEPGLYLVPDDPDQWPLPVDGLFEPYAYDMRLVGVEVCN